MSVYVDYINNGQKYEHVLVNRRENTKYNEGEMIYIYIDPENPTEVVDYDTPFTGVVLIFFGGFLMMFYFLKSSKRNKAQNAHEQLLNERIGIQK